MAVAGVAAGSALLFTVAAMMPRLRPALAAAPFPLIAMRMRGSRGSALMAALLAAGFVGVLLSPGQALQYLLLLVAPALLMGEAMAQGRGLVRACTWAFVLVTLEIGAALVFDGAGMSSRALHLTDEMSAYLLGEMRTGAVPVEQVEAWTQWLAQLREVLTVVYPAAYVIGGALLVLANGTLLRMYLARRDPGWLEGGEFEGIRWPIGLAMAFVFSGFGVALVPLRPVVYNVLLVLTFFLALQGLAVVAYYARRLAAPPLFRAAVVILVLVNPWAPQILALLGLFDAWIDFRKWAEPPTEKA
jgi:predicted membrane protein DUF2232